MKIMSLKDLQGIPKADIFVLYKYNRWHDEYVISGVMTSRKAVENYFTEYQMPLHPDYFVAYNEVAK